MKNDPSAQGWRARMASIVLVVLAASLLPLGLYGAYQQRQINTLGAALHQREVITRAHEASIALGHRIALGRAGLAIIGARRPAGDAAIWDCAAAWEHLATRLPGALHLAFYDANGRARCAAEAPLPPALSAQQRAALARGLPALSPAGRLLPATLSDTITLIRAIGPPGEIAGYHSLSLEAPIRQDLYLRGASGQILSRSARRPPLPRPTGRDASMGADAEFGTFAVPGPLPGTEVVGTLRTPQVRAAAGSALLSPSAMLAALWLLSSGAGFFALRRLLLRDIKALGRQMRDFTHARSAPDAGPARARGAELRQMRVDFLEMAETIARDAQFQAAAGREQRILLKEVHHRVRNNLQLISSIMNMQIRRADEAETRRAILRLQDRLRTLSTVHESLYQGGQLTCVDAAALITGIIRTLVPTLTHKGGTVPVTLSLEPVLLDTDQATPLALMVSEIVANVLHEAGDRDDLWLSISLSLAESGHAELLLRSSVSDGRAEHDPGSVSGQLIRAFCRQLGATPEFSYDGAAFCTRLCFAIVRLEPCDKDF